MVQFWKQVGFSYLKYANLCAKMVRNSLKEPYKTKAISERESFNFNFYEWKNGKVSRPSNIYIYIIYFKYLKLVPQKDQQTEK